MFDHDYSFRGKHATYVKMLTFDLGDNRFRLFEKNIDVYALAAVVGFTYNIRAKRDLGSDKTNILSEAFSNNKRQLINNYRMIMLLHDKENVDVNERIARAFKYDNVIEKRKVGDDIFESYVLGGVEKIFEKVFGTLTPEDAELDIDNEIKNLYTFLEEFELRYQERKTDSEILDLCKLAAD